MAKRKSFAEAVQSAETAAPAKRVEEKPVEFHKFTVPLRTDQIDALTQALAKLTIEQDVVFTKAVVIRLALDRILERLARDPDTVIADLYELEQRELAANENRRVSVSRGAEEYLQSVGRL